MDFKELEAKDRAASEELRRAIEGLNDGSSTLEQAEAAIRARGEAGYQLQCAKGRAEVDTAVERMIKDLRRKHATLGAVATQAAHIARATKGTNHSLN